jgi:DNA damage-binding protein 1
MFGLINSQYVNLLIQLQDELAERVQSPGDIPFEAWRAYRSQVVQNQEAPVRFVDGEFIERFLDCSPKLQEEIVDKVKHSVSGVDTGFAQRDLEWFRELVEGLRRLH